MKKAEDQPAVKLEIAPARDLPPVPPDYRNCFRQSSTKPGRSADDRVAGLIVQSEERRLCGVGFLKWYETVRKEHSTTTTQ